MDGIGRDGMGRDGRKWDEMGVDGTERNEELLLNICISEGALVENAPTSLLQS